MLLGIRILINHHHILSQGCVTLTTNIGSIFVLNILERVSKSDCSLKMSHFPLSTIPCLHQHLPET
jgi:hypothetical protein